MLADLNANTDWWVVLLFTLVGGVLSFLATFVHEWFKTKRENKTRWHPNLRDSALRYLRSVDALKRFILNHDLNNRSQEVEDEYVKLLDDLTDAQLEVFVVGPSDAAVKARGLARAAYAYTPDFGIQTPERSIALLNNYTQARNAFIQAIRHGFGLSDFDARFPPEDVSKTEGVVVVPEDQ